MKKFLVSALFACCALYLGAGELPFTNPAHLNNLYEVKEIDGKKLGIVHIYSDYPEYKWVDAGGEGITCIDDVARAGVFYIEYYKMTGDKEYLSKVKQLVNYTIHMQLEDSSNNSGYFYNFIDKDGNINKTGDTSRAEPNWWSYRALVFLERAREVLNDKYNTKIDEAAGKFVAAVKRHIPEKQEYVEYEGLKLPAFLPGDGADQAAILVMGLVDYYKNTKDQAVKSYIDILCQGLMDMQINETTKPDNFMGAFLSWKNLWHAYGNNQAYALLSAGAEFNNRKYIDAALKEINNYYPALVNVNFRNYFEVVKTGKELTLKTNAQYAQIAYGIRPMVWACLKAYDITHEKKYAGQAAQLAMWFFGKNPALVQMYNKDNGICFDGIDSAKDYNMNSGAESTIEALLALVEIEKNPVALEELDKLVNKK